VTDELDRKRTKARALFEKRLRRCREDLATFIQTVVTDDHGRRLSLAPMHHTWIAHTFWAWELAKRSLIMAHFGSGKSSSFAIPLIAWTIGCRPEIRIKVICNDDSSAKKRVAAVKKIIESPMYRAVFPDIERGEKWNDHELFVQRRGNAIDPTVHARGVLTDGIGGRADLEVYDDVTDQKKSLEKGVRDKVTQIVEQTWLSRLEPDGKVLVIGTPWHQADVLHVLMARPDFASLIQAVDVARETRPITQELRGVTRDEFASYPRGPWPAEKMAA